MKCPHCNGTGVLEAITLGAMVIAARRARGMTQQELAAAAGMGRSQVANIETDRSDVPIKTLQRLADGLGIHARELLP